MRPFAFVVGGILLSMALYAPSWSHPFVLDDLLKIQENFDLRAPFSFANFFYPYSNVQMQMRNDPSRPLTYIFYWVCWQLGKGSSVPFHALSTILHGLNGGLVALLTLNFAPLFGAATAELLFLSSPLLAGTVLYAFGLSDVLVTSWLLLGLLSAVNKKVSRRSLLFYALALLTKQSAIIFPGLILLFDYFKDRWWLDRERLCKTYLVLATIGLAYLLWRKFEFGALGDLEGERNLIPWSQYALSQGWMILKYVELTLWPQHLTIDHRIFPLENASFAWGAWCMVIGLSIAAIRAGRKKSSSRLRALGFGWCFFLLTLLPTSSFMPTVDLFVERRAYLAGVGLFLAFAGGFLARTFKMVGLLLATQIALSLNRAEVYSSPEKLWLEALREDASNPRALVNLGVYYSSIQQWEKAKTFLERAQELQPESGSLYSKLAYIYQQKSYAGHDDNKAWDAFTKALQLAPEDAFAHYNAAVFMLDHKRWAEAERGFLQAAQIAPQMTEAWLGAARVATLLNKIRDAKADYQQVLRLNPDMLEAKSFLQSHP